MPVYTRDEPACANTIIVRSAYMYTPRLYVIPYGRAGDTFARVFDEPSGKRSGLRQETATMTPRRSQRARAFSRRFSLSAAVGCPAKVDDVCASAVFSH